MFLIQPDWTMIGTKKKIETELAKYKLKLGWTESKTDTLYCEETQITQKTSPTGEQAYQIYVWNQPNARAELAKQVTELLLQPVFQV